MVAALMFRLVRQFSFALLVVATLGAAAAGQSPAAGAASLAPQQGVLVLRSGGVIRGRFFKLGDQYVVEVNGGEIRIDQGKVEVACGSLAEAYTLKRAAITHHSVSSHLRLAQWCVRQKLFDEAAVEINTARHIDNRDRRIAIVQRRLQAAQQQQVTIQRAHDQPTATPDYAELDRWLDALPRDSVVDFANLIQPLLSNSCATGACHGPTSRVVDVHVLRVQRGRSVSRRVTARNLSEVMKWVNRQRPDESPLLTVPRRPHGSAEAAIFAATDEQYQRLVDWVHSLLPPAVETAPAHEGGQLPRPFADAPVMRSQWGPTSPLLQPTRLPWRNSAAMSTSRTPIHQALAERQRQLEAAAAEPTTAEETTADDEQLDPVEDRDDKSPKGSTGGRYVPVDEFDPEIFNRRLPPAKEAETEAEP